MIDAKLCLQKERDFLSIFADSRKDLDSLYSTKLNYDSRLFYFS